jgi:hypothetical protein
MKKIMNGMGINDIISLLEKYGIKGGIVVFLVVILYLVYKSKILNKLINTLSERYVESFMRKKGKKEVVEINISDIENHDIFNYIDFWSYSKIPTFKFSTEYRTVVFKKYLIIYLESHKVYLNNFISSKKYLTMNDSELCKSFLALINDTVHLYEKNMDDNNIPQIIIDKMKVKNNVTISLTIDLIEGICNSQFYKSDDNLLKVYSILNIMLSILENTIQNSEQVCNSINGQLKGLAFFDGKKTYKEP